MFKTKIGKVLLLAVLIVVVFIGYISLSKTEGNNNTIKIAIMGEPLGLDPNLLEGGIWEYMVMQDAFTGLFETNAEGNVVPALVDMYSVSKDGLVYTFHLRDSKWSDGVPVTATDFEYSYKRILDPKTPAQLSYKLFDIKNAEKYKAGKATVDSVGIKAIDAKTLQIILEKPVGYYIQTLAHPINSPVPKHMVEKYGKDWSKPENIVTNGAYKIVEWKPKAYVRAVKNDQFYDADNVSIQEIMYYTQEDRSAILKRFRTGELDIAEDFATEQYEWLKENYPKETRVSVSNAIVFLSINSNDTKLKDKKVREALSLAIDRDFIVEKVLKTGEISSYSLVPIMSGYDPVTLPYAKWSKEKKMAEAKRLMKEAGYSKENPLKVELSYTTDGNDRKIFVAVADMWKELGVQLEINTREILVHYQELHQNNFDIARVKWTGSYDDPSTYLELFYTGAGNNFGEYSNKEYDRLFDKAKSTTDIKERYKIYKQGEKILIDNDIFIPLYYNVNRSLIRQRVQGWKPNPSNTHLVKYMSLKDTK